MMAGDWIKVEKSTLRKPEVLRIAELLGVDIDHAFGMCVRFWCWCDDHLTDGNARSVTKVTLDTLLNRSGFSEALIEVGWLQSRNGSIVVPNFDRHLSQTAKNRSLTSQRVASHKKRKGNAASVTNALPREEKRREENTGGNTNNPLTPLGEAAAPRGSPKFDPLAVQIPEAIGTAEFRSAWAEWIAYRREKKKPLSPRAVAGQLADLARYGPAGAVESIRQSIRNDWQGLFDPKDRGNGRKQTTVSAGPGQHYGAEPDPGEF